MSKMMVIILIIVFIDLCYCVVVSYNTPKFCPNASWKIKPDIFANASTIGENPVAIFVDINNTIYATAESSHHVKVWFKGNNAQSVKNLRGNSIPYSVFATLTGDIYVDNGRNKQVVKRTLNSTEDVSVMDVEANCTGLFVDINNILYCSMDERHKVVKKSLNNASNTTTLAAGNGTAGSTSEMLNKPYGIFVHINFTLYVADCGNNRIQIFQPEQLNGTTVAGNEPSKPFPLNCPRGIVLDADGYLFIVDDDNRIISSGPNGFRCVVKCSSVCSGLRRLGFDNYGSIFVTDRSKHLILKFILATNSCEATTTSLSTTTFQQTTTSLEATTSQQTLTMNMTSVEKTTTMVTTQKTSFTTVYNSTTTSKTNEPSHFFIPQCENKTRIGYNCNISNAPCDMFDPCLNNGTCYNVDTLPLGYQCVCPNESYGINCELSYRPCASNPCWNNGTCENLNKTFACRCEYGWEGSHCQTKENFCRNVTCQNRGVCRPLFRDFKCECLDTNYYSGRFCEITTKKIIILKFVSKSISFIAIIVMVSAAMFIIIMDILKYCFGIDPVRKERERIRQKQKVKKRKPVIQRFVYVNAPLPQMIEEPASTIKETVVSNKN